MAHQKRHLASDPSHAGGSLAAFTPRDESLRALAPQARLGAQLLAYTSALGRLLATDPPSHAGSQPIYHFCRVLMSIGHLAGPGVHFGVQNSGSASDRAACSRF